MNIQNILCLVVLLSFCAPALEAQESRSIDGTANNINNPDFGASHTELARVMTSGYADGISTPGGTNRPNPRVISNSLFDQSTNISDGMGLSDFLWTFGQFIDHDIVEVSSNTAEPALIPVDFNDQWFNPGGQLPNINIPMFRSMPAPGTGTDAANPRGHINNITAWLDASAVYGSDEHRANWIRTFTGGKLKTSAGNLLPWNTFSGEKGSDIDPNAPEMADDVGLADRLFVAGDVRANEQPLLIAMHTLFVREHNRLCEAFILEHPNWSDEELYQAARRWVGAIFQAIVFEEWLPAMGVHLPQYNSYNPGIDPAITNVFSAAAFRLGHTLLNGNIQRLDNNGDMLPEGNLTLAQAFFNPDVVENVGLDPYFKGMAVQVEQALDCKVIDDVRNFLFGPPGSGGLDLAAININRGRERGLPDINTIRADLGLALFTSFSDINDDAQVNNELENIYTDLDKIDPWVGMLAENPMPDALFGETIMEIMINQFQALRDGDRFYYQNDPAFDSYDRMVIQTTSLKDIIMRNTDITLMQENVFLATPVADLCAASTTESNVSGVVRTVAGEVLGESELVTLDVDNQIVDQLLSAADGTYSIPDLNTCNYYSVEGSRSINDFRNGVTNLDIILIARHILQLQVATDPVQLAAADVDGDLQISTFDLVEIQKLILYFTEEFPQQVPSWRLLPEAVVNSGVNPYPAFFNSSYDLGLLEEDTNIDWIGFKMGDFSFDAQASLNGDAQNRSTPYALSLEDKTFKAGETVSLRIAAKDLKELYGLQMSLTYDTEVLAMNTISKTTGMLSRQSEGQIDFSWYQAELAESHSIEFSFTATKAGQLSDYISIADDRTRNEIVDANFKERPLVLNFESLPAAAEEMDFVVYQNRPNPFKSQTNISWNQSEPGFATLEVFTANGSLVHTISDNFNAGLQQLDLTKADLGAAGMYFYRLSTAKGAMTKRMMSIQ